MNINYQGLTLEIDIISYNPGTPAKTYGPPEDCDEGEAQEVEYEISSVSMDCYDTFATAVIAGNFWNDGDVKDLVLQEMAQ